VELVYKHLTAPVPLDQVPEPLRPVVAAGMAKDPGDRPADIGAFITELHTVATAAYGPDWEERGRSKLGEAALLLAALWPSGEPPATAGAEVYQIPLRRGMGSVKVAMLVGALTLLVAVGVAIAAGIGPGRHDIAYRRQIVPIQLSPGVKTTPSPGATSSGSPPAQPTSPPLHPVSVPDVVGDSRSAASAAMAAAHLNVKFASVDSTAPKDLVVSTSPAAGTSVAANSTVVVSISLADEGTVPDVLGLTPDNMSSTLAAAGFTVVSTTDIAASSPSQDNTVVSQSVAAGTIALFTSPITVTIAVQPEVTSLVVTSSNIQGSDILIAGTVQTNVAVPVTVYITGTYMDSVCNQNSFSSSTTASPSGDWQMTVSTGSTSITEWEGSLTTSPTGPGQPVSASGGTCQPIP